jgi:DNA (cytosine-5)-methyltransferase 1
MLMVGSLFAGIGGLDLGLERAGMQVKWQVEIDPYCIRVLEKHWPSVKRYGDIKGLSGNELESVDVICGGFPCQDISYAKTGERPGLAGERSGLYWEMERLVRVLRPRYWLMENVPGLVNGGLNTILGRLADIGYAAEWEIIQANWFGLPHIRKRLFIVAEPNGDGRRTFAPLYDYDPEMLEHRFEDSYFLSSGNIGNTESGLARVLRANHGLSNGVDRLRTLGNAVVPQCSEFIGKLIIEAEGLTQ